MSRFLSPTDSNVVQYEETITNKHYKSNKLIKLSSVLLLLASSRVNFLTRIHLAPISFESCWHIASSDSFGIFVGISFSCDHFLFSTIPLENFSYRDLENWGDTDSRVRDLQNLISDIIDIKRIGCTESILCPTDIIGGIRDRRQGNAESSGQ